MPLFSFSYATMEKEVECFKKFANAFLEPETTRVLDSMKDQLVGVRLNRHGTSFWGIDLDSPLTTKPSVGEYQADGQGHHHVSASISSVWEVRPVDANPDRLFEVVGVASSLVVLNDVGGQEPNELGRFHVDIGGDGGPGTIFHMQIPQQGETGAFPSTLDIPRFPMPPMSPMAVTEFVLGELFQAQWRREMSNANTPHQIWLGIQRNRLLNFLDWQLQVICGRRGDTTSSPLMDLKHTGVEPSLLVDSFDRVYGGGC